MQWTAVCKPRAVMQDLIFQRTVNFSELCIFSLLFLWLLIYLSIHPPKSNSQLETSQMLYECFHVPVSILPGVIILAVHKTLCQSL